jgi:hypothetical protein
METSGDNPRSVANYRLGQNGGGMSDGTHFRKRAAQVVRRAGAEPGWIKWKLITAFAEISPSNPKVSLLEDYTMRIAEQTLFTAQSEVKNHGAMIFLGYSIFPIALLIAAIYFDSISSGTAPGDLASMVAFP